MKKIVITFLIWIFIVNIFAVLVVNRFNLKGDTAYTWIDPVKFNQQQNWDVVSLHSHWDSEWYLDIAKNGYYYKGEKELSNIVFFPLYPILIKLLSYFTLGNFILAGWFLSSIFLLFSLIYFYKLVKEFHPKIDPYHPIFFLLIFPTAFFLNALYTESLFLFLTIASFYYGLKKKYIFAGIFGIFAALTRITGVLIFIPLLWEYLRENKFKIRTLFNINVVPLFLIPLGTISFFVYHYLKFGDFLLFFKVESWWGRSFTINNAHLLLLSNPAIVNFSLDIIFVISALVITYLVFKRLRTSYGLYMISTIAIAIGTGTLMSIGRYILVLFPTYILIASIKNEQVKKTWMLISVLLIGLYITLFVNNYWAG